MVAITNPAEVIKSDITRAGDVKLRVAVLVERKRERQCDGSRDIVVTIDAGVRAAGLGQHVHDAIPHRLLLGAPPGVHGVQDVTDRRRRRPRRPARPA